MTDQRLRNLQRRWQESGSVHDEAAYLLERVRAGDLTKERLELAAYCGHEGAREALGNGAPEVPDVPREWAAGIHALAPRMLLGAATVAARLAVDLDVETSDQVRSKLAAAVRFVEHRASSANTSYSEVMLHFDDLARQLASHDSEERGESVVSVASLMATAAMSSEQELADGAVAAAVETVLAAGRAVLPPERLKQAIAEGALTGPFEDSPNDRAAPPPRR